MDMITTGSLTRSTLSSMLYSALPLLTIGDAIDTRRAASRRHIIAEPRLQWVLVHMAIAKMHRGRPPEK